MALRSSYSGGQAFVSGNKDHPSVAEIRSLLAGAEGQALRTLLVLHGDDGRAGVVDACKRARTRDRARKAERDRTAQMY